MTVRFERPPRNPGYTRVLAHSELRVFHHTEGRPFPDWRPPVKKIQYFIWNHITFHEEATTDELYYYLREREGTEDERDRLELVVGSFSTGDRIYLTNHGVKHDDEQFGHLYQRYFFWRKVDPNDPNIVIASTSRERTFNILDNSRDDGAGYQSPMDLDITLTTYGLIVLTPVYPGHERQDLLPRLE